MTQTGIRYYTGIGSRKAPQAALRDIYEIAKRLATEGFTLRSGAADGCDKHFEAGCNAQSGKSDIFLPWEGFNGNKSINFFYADNISVIAQEVYGNRWPYISSGARKMMTRNVCQILGYDFTQSLFVLCWTPDGCESASTRNKKTGGTGQAIALADYLNIPVFNFKNNNTEDRFNKYLNNLD